MKARQKVCLNDCTHIFFFLEKPTNFVLIMWLFMISQNGKWQSKFQLP